MADFPIYIPCPTHISTWSRWSPFNDLTQISGSSVAAAFAWPSANRAVYTPISLPWPFPVKRVYWINGGSAGSNADFGIYTADGVRIFSTGSTARGTASTLVYTTAEILLPPGRYYFALAFNGTTGLAYGQSTLAVANMRMTGYLQEDSAFALPATMTPAAISSGAAPICGITKTTTGF